MSISHTGRAMLAAAAFTAFYGTQGTFNPTSRREHHASIPGKLWKMHATKPRIKGGKKKRKKVK